MRTYGQYCPIARGAEVFAERWTPLIIRNLHLGCETFGEILEGAPGLSRTLLAQRLKQLERLGIVESAPKAHGRGHRYQLTSSGHDLFKVCETLGEWGSRWLEIAPREPRSIRRVVVDVQRAPPRPAPRPARGHPVRLHGLPAPRAVLVAARARRDRDLQYVPRSLRRPLHHRRGRSLRQVARRTAHLGQSAPRLPHPARRSVVAGTSLPTLERVATAMECSRQRARAADMAV